MADLSLILAAALAAGAPSAPAGTPAAPVHMITRATAGGVRISVVGSSPVAVAATYTLEVSSSGAGSNNRSRQRGTVRLRPDVPVTVITLNLGTKGAGWTARLLVEPDGAAAYEEVKSSS